MFPNSCVPSFIAKLSGALAEFNKLNPTKHSRTIGKLDAAYFLARRDKEMSGTRLDDSCEQSDDEA